MQLDFSVSTAGKTNVGVEGEREEERREERKGGGAHNNAPPVHHEALVVPIFTRAVHVHVRIDPARADTERSTCAAGVFWGRKSRNYCAATLYIANCGELAHTKLHRALAWPDSWS